MNEKKVKTSTNFGGCILSMVLGDAFLAKHILGS